VPLDRAKLSYNLISQKKNAFLLGKMATRIYTPLQSGLNTVLSKGESLIPITPTRKSHRNLFTTFELSQADRQTTDRKISTLSWIIKIKYMRLLRDNWPTVGDGDFYAFLWKVVRFRCDS